MSKYTLPPDTDPDILTVGTVVIDPKDGFDATARKLEQALGIKMEATDRFDECPGYEGYSDELRFSLLGIPPDEPEFHTPARITNFTLQVISARPTKIKSPRIFISEHLAEYLANGHGIQCRPGRRPAVA